MDENANASSPLAALLENKELLATLGGMLGASDSAHADSSAKESHTALAEGLGSVLSNPELMAKLPSMIAMLKPLLANVPTSAAAPTQPSDAPSTPVLETEDTEAISASVTHVPHRNGNSEKCRNDLLLALKPFLSREKCEAVDMILRLSALGAVLRHLQ